MNILYMPVNTKHIKYILQSRFWPFIKYVRHHHHHNFGIMMMSVKAITARHGQTGAAGAPVLAPVGLPAFSHNAGGCGMRREARFAAWPCCKLVASDTHSLT